MSFNYVDQDINYLRGLNESSDIDVTQSQNYQQQQQNQNQRNQPQQQQNQHPQNYSNQQNIQYYQQQNMLQYYGQYLQQFSMQNIQGIQSQQKNMDLQIGVRQREQSMQEEEPLNQSMHSVTTFSNMSCESSVQTPRINNYPDQYQVLRVYLISIVSPEKFQEKVLDLYSKSTNYHYLKFEYLKEKNQDLHKYKIYIAIDTASLRYCEDESIKYAHLSVEQTLRQCGIIERNDLTRSKTTGKNFLNFQIPNLARNLQPDEKKLLDNILFEKDSLSSTRKKKIYNPQDCPEFVKLSITSALQSDGKTPDTSHLSNPQLISQLQSLVNKIYDFSQKTYSILPLQEQQKLKEELSQIQKEIQELNKQANFSYQSPN